MLLKLKLIEAKIALKRNSEKSDLEVVSCFLLQKNQPTAFTIQCRLSNCFAFLVARN